MSNKGVGGWTPCLWYTSCMPALLTEHDLKQCWRLPFCYICGEAFQPDATKNRDHVPPSAIFAKEDQSPPLILPTHPSCNEANSLTDEQIGQLVAVRHGKYPTLPNLKLKVSPHRVPGSDMPTGIIEGLPFRRIVFRWLRAFHAALYRQYLPSCGGYVHPPFPAGDRPTDLSPIHPIQLEYVKTIKKNRVSKTIDWIICRNGKCRYDCVWVRADNGMPMCVFALDLYDWQQLGDTHHHPSRSCVGIYSPAEGIPSGASYDTKLEFPFSNRDILDAFGA